MDISSQQVVALSRFLHLNFSKAPTKNGFKIVRNSCLYFQAPSILVDISQTILRYVLITHSISINCLVKVEIYCYFIKTLSPFWIDDPHSMFCKVCNHSKCFQIRFFFSGTFYVTFNATSPIGMDSNLNRFSCSYFMVQQSTSVEYKGGIISDGIFNLVQSQNNELNHCLSTFYIRLQMFRDSSVIWFIFWE